MIFCKFSAAYKVRRKFRRILTKMNLIDFLRFFLRILQRSFSGSLFLFFTKFWMFLRSGSTFSAHYSAQKSDRFSKSLKFELVLNLALNKDNFLGLFTLFKLVYRHLWLMLVLYFWELRAFLPKYPSLFSKSGTAFSYCFQF